ncbi:MAG: hypothetical protein WA446_11295 [Steroidobacteraceae bacterium]
MLMCMQNTDMSHDNLCHDNLCHDNLCELVGEIANTLSGNARRSLRHQFSVAVLSVAHDRDAPMGDPRNSHPIMIPIVWHSYHARLAVCLDS